MISACLMMLLLMAPAQQEERFVFPQPGLVLDTRTGLLWMRCAVGQIYDSGQCIGEPSALNWTEARLAAGEFEQGAHFWRIPEFFELRGLLDEQATDPAIDSRAFPDTPPGWFWTNVRFAGHSQEDCFINFAGQGSRRCNLGGRFYLRLVSSEAILAAQCPS